MPEETITPKPDHTEEDYDKLCEQTERLVLLLQNIMKNDVVGVFLCKYRPALWKEIRTIIG